MATLFQQREDRVWGISAACGWSGTPLMQLGTVGFAVTTICDADSGIRDRPADTQKRLMSSNLSVALATSPEVNERLRSLERLIGNTPLLEVIGALLLQRPTCPRNT